MKKILSHPHGKLGIAFVTALIAIFAYYFYAMSTQPAMPVGQVEIKQTDHIRGATGAKVTLVEFGDFQCPACAAYEPLVRQVLADNKDSLQVVFRHFPLTQIHQNALLAARASEAAGLQGKFWEMHDMLYDYQKSWSGLLNAREIFVSYAATLGLDVAQFSADMDSSVVEEKILAEYREGTKLGVGGTPTFFINGKMIESPSSLEEFDALIKAAANNQ
jgi:protein-disulfide isomerase